ncbi:O-antigen ligase family protein [Aliarcobacter butzleri]
MNDKILYFLKDEDRYVLFIYLYLFLMPWNFFKWQMGVYSILIFLWWMVKYKNSLKSKIKNVLEFKPLLVFIIFLMYVYITPFWSDSWKEGFDYVNDFYKYHILLIPVLFTSLNVNQAKKSLKIIIISFISYSIFSICIYLGFFSITETRSDELNPKGIMGYSIVTIYMAVGSIASFIIGIFYKNKNYKILFFISSFLCFFALVVNNSRTSQLAFILSILIILIIVYNKSIFKLKNFLVGSITFIILLSVSIYLLNNAGKLDRFILVYKETKIAFKENKFEGSVGFRLYFNLVGIEIIKNNNFIFGMGPVDNTKELTKIMKEDPRWTSKLLFNKFHNTHLDLITRYGYLGYILLWFSIIYLFLSIKDKDMYYFIGLSFFAVIFFTSFANGTFEKKPVNYIIISIFVLLSIMSSKNKKSDVKKIET